MSSHEVIKHSRKILGVVKDKNTSWKHKVGEIVFEILIIVFAISLSLFLERWREKNHDHEIEKNFLIGLQEDLHSDLTEMKDASTRAISMNTSAKYFLKPDPQISWASDSVKAYGYGLFHNLYFFPNADRFESLKSSGKLDVIRNEGLRSDIINLYQTQIPDLQLQVSLFNTFMNAEVKDHLIRNLKRNEKNEPIIDKAFLSSLEIKNILYLYNDLDDVLKRLNKAIAASEKILAEIDEVNK